MRDYIVWIKCVMDTEAHGKRAVYIKHAAVPFAGLIALPDTAFTIPAFIRVKGKRVQGFVTPREASWFVAFKGKA